MTQVMISGYPQMPSFNREETVSFLTRPLIAKLGTINEDGTIHLVPVFFRYDNGDFILGTQEVSRKVRNIKRNSQVTLLIDATDPVLGAVIIYGKAQLEYDQVVEKRTSIFAKYEPIEKAGPHAQGLVRKWKSLVIRIKPDRIVSFDYAKGTY